MTVVRRALLSVMVACAILAPSTAQAQSSIERATDSVVAITAGADRIGTGFIIAPDRVLTVAHVIDAASGLEARVLVDNRLEPYRVLAIDRMRDLALIEVSLPDSIEPIAWAEGAELQRGQDVIVLGFPIGLKSVSLTKGVVSSPAQTYDGVTYVQTDAAINPGNSGGPLIDEQGRLVGINVAKISGTEVDGVGFSIPVDDVRMFLAVSEPDIAIVTDSGAERAGGSVWWVLGPALAATGFGALAAGLFFRRQQRRLAHAAAAAATVRRYRFGITTASSHAEKLVRLPSVVGTAHNADIRVEDATAYAVRLSASGEGVTALELTDTRGLFCAEGCVRETTLAPGQSFRIGSAEVAFLGIEDVPSGDAG